MDYFVWLIVGIILLTITIFVHKNTYKTYEQDHWSEVGAKLSTPRWLCIVASVVAIIPILNAAAFTTGFIVYCSALIEDDIVFRCESRWWKSLMGWLTKEV